MHGVNAPLALAALGTAQPSDFFGGQGYCGQLGSRGIGAGFEHLKRNARDLVDVG